MFTCPRFHCTSLHLPIYAHSIPLDLSSRSMLKISSVMIVNKLEIRSYFSNYLKESFILTFPTFFVYIFSELLLLE